MKSAAFHTQYSASALKTLDIELQALEMLKAAVTDLPLGQSIDAAVQAIATTRGG